MTNNRIGISTFIAGLAAAIVLFLASCKGGSKTERERSPSRVTQNNGQNQNGQNAMPQNGNQGQGFQGQQMGPQGQMPQGPVGPQNNGNGINDLLGQAGDLLNQLGNGNDTDTETETETETETKTDETDPLDLYLFDHRDTEKYFTTMPAGPVQGESPHGIVQIFYTNNLFDQVNNENITAPVGTIAVKEFDNDGTVGVDGLAIMIKQEAGYDADGNDWYYALLDKWGAIIDDKVGVVNGCKSCHGAGDGAQYDYLLGMKKAAGN